ncbi:MAG: glycosyltransferase [Labilithrix sp.]|nr:glycosyltransferase [Labilithrix sp.]
MDLTNVVADVVAVLLGAHVVLMGCFHVLFRRRRGGSALCHGEILKRGAPRAPAPPGLVSILKPLAGRDDDLDDNLESFAHLRQVRYEILFGVASPSDPALPAARAFVARHPEIDARIVFTDPNAATNPKIAQLIGLAEAARGDVFVTSDSNVRVGPDYLDRVVAPLGDPSCGLVTSVFAGTGERTLGAGLENLQLSAIIMPCVVLSTFFVPITIGKSMAMRRVDLDRLGGFAPFGDVLAEDAVIGRRVADDGMRIATSFYVIENRNVAGSLAKTFDRHARWAKMRRAIVPGFFALEPLFAPVNAALLGVVLAPSRITIALLGLSVIVQTLTSLAAAWTIRGAPLPWRYAPLELVRTFVMLGCWASGWVSRTIVWRGHAFTIGKLSTITPMPPVGDHEARQDAVDLESAA